MSKHFLLVLAMGAIITGTSCKKTYNCKCLTNGITVTDFYDQFKNADDARTWCDETEVRMNNGNNPQKDSSYCAMYQKKQ